jgi:hypothetical protein
LFPSCKKMKHGIVEKVGNEILHSERYHPDEGKCCERCVFGSGKHASWCPERKLVVVDLSLQDYESQS